MQHVYHWKPPGFRGAVIYPLNQLRAVYPDRYEAAAAKYRGREWLMDEVIPLLGVRWNDVVHCAPIHPRHVYVALQRHDPQPVAAREWFRIPVARLRPHRVVYYKHRFLPPLPPAPRTAADQAAYAADFEPFAEARYRELAALPAATIAHFESALAGGRRPLLFNWVPHILVDGTIDVSGVAVVEWSRPPADDADPAGR
jgi:hypothetical protein